MVLSTKHRDQPVSKTFYEGVCHMKKTIAILFAIGIFMLSCPVRNNLSEKQAEEISPLPTMTAAAEISSELKSVIPPAQFAASSPAPAPETTAVPERKEPAAEALPYSSQPEPDYEIPGVVPAQAPAHVHEWVPVKTTVHFEAVVEEIKVVDVPGTEGHFEGGSYEVMVCRCGEAFTSYSDWLTHAHAGGSEQHGGFTTDVRCDQVWVEGTPETAHYETVTVQPAYGQEIIVGTVCATCGTPG